jgi:hypothetical protein
MSSQNQKVRIGEQNEKAHDSSGGNSHLEYGSAFMGWKLHANN